MSQSEKEPEEKIGFSGLQPVQMFPVWITGFTEWFKEYEDDDASIVLFCVCVCMIFFTFFKNFFYFIQKWLMWIVVPASVFFVLSCHILIGWLVSESHSVM